MTYSMYKRDTVRELPCTRDVRAITKEAHDTYTESARDSTRCCPHIQLYRLLLHLIMMIITGGHNA